MSTRPAISARWIAVAALLVLLGGYVGAYYGTVAAVGAYVGPPVPVYQTGWNELDKKLVDVPKLVDVFAPIDWLDRHIRPHVWRTP